MIGFKNSHSSIMIETEFHFDLADFIRVLVWLKRSAVISKK
jgi:hypothetical protein